MLSSEFKDAVPGQLGIIEKAEIIKSEDRSRAAVNFFLGGDDSPSVHLPQRIIVRKK